MFKANRSPGFFRLKRGATIIDHARRPWPILFVTFAMAWAILMFTPGAAGSSSQNESPHSLTSLQLEIQKQRVRLSSTEAEERRDALMRLGGLHRAEASRAALSALTDLFPVIRATAAFALSSLPAAESAAALVPLLNDKDEFVRQQVSYALGGMKNRSAVAAIIERLKTDKKDSVRGAAAVALGQIGDDAGVIALAEVLSSGGSAQMGSRKRKPKESEFILRATAHSLGEIGSRAGAPVLIAVLSNDSMPDDVRREAALALGLIGDSAAIPALRAALTANDPYLSRIASEALRKIASNPGHPS